MSGLSLFERWRRWRLKRWGRRFMATGQPTDKQVKRALAIARERGWLTDGGWVWERDRTRWPDA